VPIGLLVLVALVASSDCLPAGGADEESKRVELVARLERSVVVVLAQGREIQHGKRSVELVPFESLGTGVVISADGLILTAAHVVAGADRIRVKLEGGEPLPSRVVFADEAADIALLRLESVRAPLVPAKLGDSNRVRKGEETYVIGNPVGIEFSLSTGVVSGRHPIRHVFGGSVEAEVIQTDAAINSGNSGGPIFNRRGEVIAIAQRILTEGGGSEGLGFGLAIDVVKKILGMDPCVWLGFSGVPLTEAWTAALNVPFPGGLLVESVAPGGPAERAGIRGGEIPVQIGRQHAVLGGDVIVEVDGLPIGDWLREPTVTGASAGEPHELRLTVVRAGRTLEVPVTVVHRPAW
jgi:S1-C subfamily serine protease